MYPDENTKQNQKTFQSLIDSRSKFCRLALSLFLVTIIIFSNHVLAIGDINIGSLEFHPFLNSSSGYEDNVFLAPEGDPNEKSSAYTSYSPGLSCDWNKNNYRIQLSYLYEFFKYDKSEVDDKDLFDLNSSFVFRFGKSGNGIDLDGGYRYRKTSDPFTSEQQADNRKESSSKFAVRFNLRDRFGLGFNSKLIKHRFMDDGLARKWNKDVINLSSKASIMPFTKTCILLEYGLTMIEYKDPNKSLNDDSKIHSLLTGLEWKATEKLFGAIKAGYQWKKYDYSKGSGTGSPDTWKVEIGLKHTFSEFTSLQLSFERNIEDSDFKYSGKDAGFYYSNQLQCVFNHKLNYKLETWLDVFYNYSDYNNVSREDEVWQLDLGLSYQFLDWIWASIDYQSRMRDTNIGSNELDSFDYKSNQYSVGLNLIF